MLIPALEEVIARLQPRQDDDGVDKFNYSRTTYILGIMVVIIGMKQYVGEPLQCWVPSEFRSTWESYIESYCFVENTYYVDQESQGIPAVEERRKTEVQYYQWVPIVLSLQLFLFFLPKVFWTTMSGRTGLNVRAIVGEQQNGVRVKVKKDDDVDSEDQEALAADYLITILQFNRVRKDFLFGFLPAALRNRYTTIIYLLYKVLNCVNTFGQLYAMNQFLNTSYDFWGIGILMDLLTEKTWQKSGHFPRVTYCDVMRRDDTSGRPLTFTVQCVLMINMFNEKMYIFLWFWFAFVSVLNVANLFYWLFIIIVPGYSQQFIKQLLHYRQVAHEPLEVRKFIATSLPIDGIIALRLVSINRGDKFAAKIVSTMFTTWRKSTVSVLETEFQKAKGK